MDALLHYSETTLQLVLVQLEHVISQSCQAGLSPRAYPAQGPSLVLNSEPPLDSPNPIKMDLVKELIRLLDHALVVGRGMPKAIPPSRKVIPVFHYGGIIRVSVIACAAIRILAKKSSKLVSTYLASFPVTFVKASASLL